jgi:hypothetical protein
MGVYWVRMMDRAVTPATVRLPHVYCTSDAKCNKHSVFLYTWTQFPIKVRLQLHLYAVSMLRQKHTAQMQHRHSIDANVNAPLSKSALSFCLHQFSYCLLKLSWANFERLSICSVSPASYRQLLRYTDGRDNVKLLRVSATNSLFLVIISTRRRVVNGQRQSQPRPSQYSLRPRQPQDDVRTWNFICQYPHANSPEFHVMRGSQNAAFRMRHFNLDTSRHDKCMTWHIVGSARMETNHASRTTATRRLAV